MAKLIYGSNTSLDGWTEDEHGGFDWAPPDDDVFASITELMRSTSTYLYGRRMYETMAVWETDPSLATRSDLTRSFASAWQAADKVVYSTTLDHDDVRTARTALEPRFDAETVRERKAAATDDLLVGGPNLAAQAFRAGLVDECHLYVWPVVLGGRNPALPAANQRIDLELLDEHRFASGAVRLRYRVLRNQ
jgi:dihydrofolate reductase